MSDKCIIALDLGTTSFKSAPVSHKGLIGEPVIIEYSLDYHNSCITFDAQDYFRTAIEAIKAAVKVAKESGCAVMAVGISSQAQTYIALDNNGNPLNKAVSWLDYRAQKEAEDVFRSISDFSNHTGFNIPNGQLFLPKILHFQRNCPISLEKIWKFLLLNEYVIYRLTGRAYGDNINQGMGGFYDIMKRNWSQTALSLADITSDKLADTAPTASIFEKLNDESSNSIGIGSVPVYSCGNDQSCGAIGAGLNKEGDILCNFGTAMVVYTLKNKLPGILCDNQIAGISPLRGMYFLLGVISECGKVIDWANKVFYPDRSISDMIEESVSIHIDANSLPETYLTNNGRININKISLGCDRGIIVRSILEYYAGRFKELFEGITKETPIDNIYVSGGLSHSNSWLKFLENRFGIKFIKTTTEHPGLLGISQIIKINAGKRSVI